MALYPEDATLQVWTKISEAREFSGLPVAVFEALQARLGSLGDALRNVAILPADVWTGAIAAARVSEAVGRLQRKRPFFRAVGALSSLWTSTLLRLSSRGRARRLSHLAGRRRRRARARPRVASSKCLPWSTRWTTQLQALYHRTMVLGNAPYVDHAVCGPFGRKTTRANKFRTWIPTSDGSKISKESPGPENFQQWLSSWRVFEAAAIMLDLI